MQAMAQVGAGTNVQVAERDTPDLGKAAADFRDALQKTMEAAKDTVAASLHAREKKTEKDVENSGKSSATTVKATDEIKTVAANAPAVVQDRNAEAPVVAFPMPLQQVQLGPVIEGSVTAAAGTKRADGAAHAKSVAPAAKKDAGLSATAATDVKAGSQKLAVPAIAVGGSAVPTAGKDVPRQADVTPASVAGVALMGNSKSSFKMPLDTVAPGYPGTTQPEQIHTFAATPNVLEVGLADTAHGWIRVRAEVGTGGEVSAQVVTASASAAENLHRDLPQLTAYLASEQVGVSSLTVNAAEKGAGAQDAAMSFNGGGSSAGQQTQQRASSDGGFEVEEMAGLSLPGGMGFLAASMMSSGSGGWLSVRV